MKLFRLSVLLATLLAFSVVAIPTQSQELWDSSQSLDDWFDNDPIVVRSASVTITAATYMSIVQVPAIKLQNQPPIFITAAELQIRRGATLSGAITTASVELAISPQVKSGSETAYIYELVRSNAADTAAWMQIPAITNFGIYRVPVNTGDWVKINTHGTSNDIDVTLKWIIPPSGVKN